MPERRRPASTLPRESGEETGRSREMNEAVRYIRQQIRRYGITPDQLFGPELADLVRYQDPNTGLTWNGHGRPPDWIRGKDRDRYCVR